MKYEFEWTPDCQGKWDYDGQIIYVSTRYWPRGGSWHLYQDGKFVSDSTAPERQHIRPSAHASIHFMEYDRVLADKKFEGETEEEVKEAVKVWVDQQIQLLEKRLISLLFPSTK